MSELAVPIYYVASSNLSDDEWEGVKAALTLTPVVCVVITDVGQMEHAACFSEQTILAPSEQEAHGYAREIASQTALPILVIGEAAVLDAVYDNGERSPVM